MTGTLYVVATPIGNLADASPRALETLRAAHLIACEDTRTSRTLLARYGISAKTLPLHGHNERSAANGLIQAPFASAFTISGDVLRSWLTSVTVPDAGA